MNDLSCIQNVKTVHTDPYPYVCVEGALPENRYRELCETFPMELVTSTTPHDGGITYRYKMKECADTPPPPIWQDFFAYHTSAEYFKACVELFAPSISKTYGDDFLHNLLQGSVTPRDVDNSGQYVADCQFVVHEPVDQTGTSRTPHVDNPVEIYAGLLYMRQPGDIASGGNFTVHRATGEITQVNKSLGRQVDDSLHIPHFEVPYEANNFCMFLNVKDSVHGVTPRIAPTMRRRSINIIGEFNGNGRMWKVKEIKS
jgi:hypothetical protein